MATKVFDKALMASESVQSYVGSCKYMENDEYARIHDGALVNLGDLAHDDVYGADSLDYNVYEAIAPQANHLSREEVVIVDLSSISEGIINGNEYKIGVKLVNRELEAGFAARFRRLMKGDKFWIGEGNFEAAPAIGDVANAKAGQLTFAMGANDPDVLSVKVLASKALTVGQSVYAKGTTPEKWEQLYLVEVM